MKVYVVEVGAYEDRAIVQVFASRELAETYCIEASRAVWEPKPGWSFGIGRGRPFPERGDMTFEEWCRIADDTWNAVGDITEWEVLTHLPPITEEEWRAAGSLP